MIPLSRRRIIQHQTAVAANLRGAASQDYLWSFELIHALACGPLHPFEPVVANWPLVLAAFRRYGMPEREVAAAAIATIGIETAHSFEPVAEAYYLLDQFGGDEAALERWRQANFRYYPYYGRGFVQTTWLSNYREGEIELGIPLVEHPELALRPDVAANLMALYFRNHGTADAARARNWGQVRYSVLGGYDGSAYIKNVAEQLLAA